MTTPLVFRGGAWAIERPQFFIRTGSAFENPHGIPRQELMRMVHELPAEIAAQTIFGKYVDASGLVFQSAIVQNLFDRSIAPIVASTFLDVDVAHQARLWYETKGWWGDRFATGVDLARRNDYTVIITIDTAVAPARVVYYRRTNRVPWSTIYGEIGRVRELFGPNILLDGTGVGDVVLNELEGLVYCVVHRLAIPAGYVCMRDGEPIGGCSPSKHHLPMSCCTGYVFGEKSKKQLVDHLRIVLGSGYDQRNPGGDFGLLRSPPIPQLQEEMTFYAWEDKKLETDCLFSLALAAWEGLEDQAGTASVGSPYAGARS